MFYFNGAVVLMNLSLKVSNTLAAHAKRQPARQLGLHLAAGEFGWRVPIVKASHGACHGRDAVVAVQEVHRSADHACTPPSRYGRLHQASLPRRPSLPGCASSSSRCSPGGPRSPHRRRQLAVRGVRLAVQQ